MKSSHLIFLSIYVTCIILGVVVGNALKQAVPSDKNMLSALDAPQSIPTLKNGQHNLLVIAVDNLELQNPQLISIWLVTYFINNPSVTFLPISPTPSAGNVIVDEEIIDSFEIRRMDDNIKVSPSFFHTLSKNNFWWSGYLIVDQEAFSKLLNDKSGMAANTSTPGSDTNSQDPEVIYQAYTQIFRNTCELISQQSGNVDWQAFRGMIPQHIITDLDANLMISEWASSTESVEIPNCFFPLDSNSSAMADQ